MRYLSLSILVIIVVCFCLWQQLREPPINYKSSKRKHSTGIKWNDSLFKHLPENIDTSVIVFDIHGTPLHFHQYIKPVFEHNAMIYHDRGLWKLHRFTDGAKDSLDKDVHATAKSARYIAFREVDTISSWKVKLNAIAETLAQADYVLVLKSKRLMLLKRKGLIVKTLKIDLGFTPIGQKSANKDGKTPEGIYHLDMKYARPDKFYKSIWVSYPNAEEKALAKSKGIDPGFGISIHGTPKTRINAKDWTAGCIALQNNDIDTAFKYIPEGVTIEIKK
ncbi:L,D-transpeptidase family protein [Pedobacter sp. LMG 31464]|uniref:L,D-transpeptidase family protein n=1 Tax=Pedobacter planticolens TaxID=2679964 RepID=A0A923IVS5_9SPHI|nr:L,D-transpeptidase family protein [Pedobacter planticolens]MBB2146173.1 L,D-transpeptidase family protein [Pedobacter planticolens]